MAERTKKLVNKLKEPIAAPPKNGVDATAALIIAPAMAI
jgi:hypothetical protein